ncbi:MAG: RNA polymerase sporulation sigma factor SigH [Bacillota bacterium]
MEVYKQQLGQEKMSNYKQMSDDELIKKSRNDDNKAVETLIRRYQNLIYAKAKLYFLNGGDKKDIIQEGMIGLYKAIRDYEIDKNSSFSSFASMCIIRNIISAIKAANRNKKQPLNSSISLNKPIYDEDSDRNLLDIFQDKDNLNNPEELIISKYKIDLIKNEIKEISTELEFNVIQEYLKGKSYKKIAETLDIHTKSVDNALQRFKKKLKKFLKNNDI